MKTDSDPNGESEHHEHSSSSSMEEVCPICHVTVGTETPDNLIEAWASLPCGHRFGSHCLKSWLGMADPPVCPMCRTDAMHICGHPYLPRIIVTPKSTPRATSPAKRTMESSPADGTPRRRSKRLMDREAAAAAAAANARPAATAAGRSGSSTPTLTPSSSSTHHQRPSTPTPSFPSTFSSPVSATSSAPSPTFSSTSASTSSVPPSPLSAVSINVATSAPVGAKPVTVTKPGLQSTPTMAVSLETLFPRAPPINAACTYCFAFLEKQYKEELRMEEAAAAERAKIIPAVSVGVPMPNNPVVAGNVNAAIDAMDGSEDYSDEEEDDDISDDDECDSPMMIMTCSRKDRIVQMAMGVFAAGCADPARLSYEERRKVAAHWERWRISHGKVFGAWWAAQAPETEPAIERQTQGWVR